MRTWKVVLTPLLLAAIAAAVMLIVESPVPRPDVAGAQPALQDGDYLVGIAVDAPGTFDVKGQIVRVRGSQAAEFCTSPANPYQEGFFNVPREVVIDAQGRIVFLAYLGSSYDWVNEGGWGLWRCDSMGGPPTLLGAFGAEHSSYANYPNPLGSRDVRQAHGLHLKLSKGVDLNDLTMATDQFYVFAVGDDCCSGTSPHDTIAYNPATGQWIDTFEDPVPTAGYYLDMINADGYTFSAAGAGLRAFTEPVRLDFQIGEFSGGLALQGRRDLIGAVVDATDVANFDPGNCPPPLDGITNAMPLNPNVFNSMTGFYSVAWNDGLVLQSDSVAAGHAFLPEFSLALLNLDPYDDKADKFHHGYLNCDIVDAPKYTPWNSSFWDSDGTPRNVRQMTPNGTAGTSGDKIVSLTAPEVETIAEGLSSPTGIDVYPGFTPPIGGLALFFKVNSPVDVLITGPDGRRIGVDPTTGQAVNDFGDGGYHSKTNEPHIYGIRDPGPGHYTIAVEGTGSGPFTITSYGVDLATEVITHTSFTGSASPGSQEQGGVTVDGGQVSPLDTDHDGAPDTSDNCPAVWNPNQWNADTQIGNGMSIAGYDATVPNAVADDEGDACETDGDADNDGIPDTSDSDPGGDITYDDNNDGTWKGTGDDGPSWDSNANTVRDGVEAICPLALNPTGDDDADGLLNSWEVCKWGTDPSLQDSDGDTIKDCKEAADVSGDGLVDFVADTVYYAKAALLPAALFGKDGDFDLNGDGLIDFVADVVQETKFALIPGLCK